jgi:hypothetical protein
VYNLWGSLQLVYGGTLGFWYVDARDYKYKNYNDVYKEEYNFVAPFIKLRWKFIELTYRGLLGYNEMDYEDGSGNYVDENTLFGWNSHQLMLGFYVSRSIKESRFKESGFFDYYVAPKYQTTKNSLDGVNIELECILKNGMFFGIDGSFGFSGGYESYMFGGGLSLGRVYNLWGSLQLVYGGTLGFWYVDVYYDKYKNYSDFYEEEYNFVAPFIKLRWKFIELTYRGLLGYNEMEYEDGPGHYVDENTLFGWNNHQLMFGVYFATKTNKRHIATNKRHR